MTEPTIEFATETVIVYDDPGDSDPADTENGVAILGPPRFDETRELYCIRFRAVVHEGRMWQHVAAGPITRPTEPPAWFTRVYDKLKALEPVAYDDELREFPR